MHPLELRPALRRRHPRLPLPRTTEDIPLHLGVRVSSAYSSNGQGVHSSHSALQVLSMLRRSVNWRAIPMMIHDINLDVSPCFIRAFVQRIRMIEFIV